MQAAVDWSHMFHDNVGSLSASEEFAVSSGQEQGHLVPRLEFLELGWLVVDLVLEL